MNVRDGPLDRGELPCGGLPRGKRLGGRGDVVVRTRLNHSHTHQPESSRLGRPLVVRETLLVMPHPQHRSALHLLPALADRALSLLKQNQQGRPETVTQASLHRFFSE